MANVALVLGLGIAAAVLVYFAFKWNDKEHVILHLLVSFFVLYLLILIPKAIMDSPEDCFWSVNETQEYGVNSTGHAVALTNAYNITTLNTYEYICGTNTYKTDDVFYRIMVWFFGLFLIYIFVYLFYSIFRYMRRDGEFRWPKRNS